MIIWDNTITTHTQESPSVWIRPAALRHTTKQTQWEQYENLNPNLDPRR